MYPASQVRCLLIWFPFDMVTEPPFGPRPASTEPCCAQDDPFLPFVCPMDHVLSPWDWEAARVDLQPAVLLDRLVASAGNGIHPADAARNVTVQNVSVAPSPSDAKERNHRSGVVLPVGITTSEARRLLHETREATVLRLQARGTRAWCYLTVAIRPRLRSESICRPKPTRRHPHTSTTTHHPPTHPSPSRAALTRSHRSMRVASSARSRMPVRRARSTPWPIGCCTCPRGAPSVVGHAPRFWLGG